MSDTGDEDFMARRDAARERLDRIFGSKGGDADDRRTWFEEVYDTAEGDPAAVPWADLKPKDKLLEWLEHHPGEGRRAIDIACGLGDNAEALAAAGYRTTAFDLAQGAVDWARARFPNSRVEYLQADLFSLPEAWRGAFDLVNECYTVQALHGELREKAYSAIAGLVKSGGVLLVISRSRGEGEEASGPPWPLMPSEFSRFEGEGLKLVGATSYIVERPGRVIPHVIAEYRRD